MKLIKFGKIPIEKIVPDKFQPRQNLTSFEVDDLAKDFKERGQVYPIIVTKENGKYLLQDGERRYRAAQSLGWKEIEAIEYNVKTKLDEYELQFVTNVKRVQITLEEMATAMERYRVEFYKKHPKFGEKELIEKLIDITGYSRQHFSSADEIIKCSPRLRMEIKKGRLGDSVPMEIFKATKDKAIREGLEDGFIEGNKYKKRPISALAVRILKRKFDKISKSGKYNYEQKKNLAKGMLFESVDLNTNGDMKYPVGNYDLIIEMIDDWSDKIHKMPIAGLKNSELDEIANALGALQISFRERRSTIYGSVGKNYKRHK